jgi:hypothetical protein
LVSSPSQPGWFALASGRTREGRSTPSTLPPIVLEVLIMQIAVHEFLLGLREALTIWLALIGIALVALTCMLAPDRLRRWSARCADQSDSGANRGDSAANGGDSGAKRRAGREKRPRPAQVRRNRLAMEAADLARYADEVAVAAKRARVTAERRHDGWVAAQNTRDSAWRAFEAADAAARRVLLARAFPVPATPLIPSEFADRERYLHRAATDAYRRGELSVDQLIDALAHRNGWDARRHPFEQDEILRQVAQHRLWRVYQTAADHEQAAWHAAEVAAAARRSLEDEAFAAQQRARRAAMAVADRKPRRLPDVRTVQTPSLATR